MCFENDFDGDKTCKHSNKMYKNVISTFYLQWLFLEFSRLHTNYQTLLYIKKKTLV